MVRQDYIIRMIEKFAQVLAQIVGRNEAGDFAAAHGLIAQTTEELIGLEPEAVLAAGEAKLISELIKGKSPLEARERCFMLVTLMAEAGNAFGIQGLSEKQRACQLKALNLQLAIGSFADEDVVPEHVPKIDVLLADLNGTTVPPQTLVALMQFYESHGQFAKAEDRLFELIEQIENRTPALELGNSFFHRLLAKDDESLERGGLPRVEVEAGLAELDRIHAGEW